jgi:hypothetical protein
MPCDRKTDVGLVPIEQAGAVAAVHMTQPRIGMSQEYTIPDLQVYH